MRNFSFREFLTSNISADPEVITQLLQRCQRKSYKKGDFLILAGANCSHIFFVEKGVLRQYSIDEKGKEHILQFAPEGWLLNDRESMYFNQPSKYYIEALENTDVFILDEKVIDQLALEIPSFSTFNTELLNNHIRHLQNRINLLLSATAEERYLTFIQMYPDILLRVPQWMVASYLGITAESLSRVRKELVAKNFKKTS
ncbi:Crp/Fnr family transcriptional regulator [Brumimicrobium oceani]|uniref:Cyclic nucleotide-binding protein n=1 Tax=Brumimicrobium oceani TaxID=2100725 RepID=A0A2U2XCH3_9FLAO|nr:Crp/Fnr family transcriptional regulator [Brumimicrobium oceani]PWH85492.1 cyclic nucleotide-binding protein [Brumimicrobium oceani]